MQVIMEFIYQTLLDMGYKPGWNKSKTGFSFHFQMEFAICRIDPETLVVTFMVPNIFPVVNSEFEAAISSFFADSYDSVPLRTRYAVNELSALMHDFFEAIK